MALEQGTVEAVSAYGFKTSKAKDAQWYNWANEFDGERALTKGEHIEFRRNAKGFVDTLHHLDRPAGATKAGTGGGPAGSRRSETDTLIVRQVSVKAAIELLAHHAAWIDSPAIAKAQSVIVVALSLERYIVTGKGGARMMSDPTPEPENGEWESADSDEPPFE